MPNSKDRDFVTNAAVIVATVGLSFAFLNLIGYESPQNRDKFAPSTPIAPTAEPNTVAVNIQQAKRLALLHFSDQIPPSPEPFPSPSSGR